MLLRTREKCNDDVDAGAAKGSLGRLAIGAAEKSPTLDPWGPLLAEEGSWWATVVGSMLVALLRPLDLAVGKCK